MARLTVCSSLSGPVGKHTRTRGVCHAQRLSCPRARRCTVLMTVDAHTVGGDAVTNVGTSGQRRTLAHVPWGQARHAQQHPRQALNRQDSP